MGHELRVRAVCADASTWLGRMRTDLPAHQITVAEVGATTVARDGGRQPPMLVLFDALTADVLGVVAESSRDGRDRTLAVATTRRGLGESGAWALLRAGASDAFAWDEVGQPLAHVAARLDRWARVDALVDAPTVRRDLVGGSPRWLACLRHAVEIAVFSDGPVLLLGESGTGKELLARLVHALDSRPDKGDLIVLDCTTVVPDLAGSEFFGHERGAYTGAVAARDGAFALADRGTLFLDEVGELPPALQAQLLRVVQERTYKRVGSNVWHRTNFRLLCATHRDLRQDVAAGRFRNDLYHRIASRICRLPSLADRREDILPLARQFLRGLRPGTAGVVFDQTVARFLVERAYPGNVRELRQLVERIGDRHVGHGPITTGDVPDEEWADGSVGVAAGDRAADGEGGGRAEGADRFDAAVVAALDCGFGLRDIGRAATEAAIRVAIASEAGNLQRAAKRLGVTDRALQLRRAQRPDS